MKVDAIKFIESKVEGTLFVFLHDLNSKLPESYFHS